MKVGYELFYVALSILLFLCVYYFTKLYIKLVPIHKIQANPNDRTIHKKSIPTGGGIGFALFHLVFLFISMNGIVENDVKTLIYYMTIGGSAILFLGFIDDKYSIKAIYKFIAQILIAYFMVEFGFKISVITNIFGDPFYLHNWSIPITIVWYVFLMNAINLIDGLDGLAAGIAIISSLVLMVYSFFNRNFFVFINCNFLALGLIAFLRFNYFPAKVFMGDTGSLFIGFMLASLSIAGNEVSFKGLTTFTLLIPVTVMFLPIADTVFTFVRRVKSKQLIFSADKKHLHHMIIEKGFSQKTVTLMFWFITLVFGVIALGYMFVPSIIMFIMLFLISILLICLFFYIYKKEE